MEQDPKPHYPLSCPLCGIAMIGEKTEPEQPDFDLHRCLSCGTVVEIPGLPPSDDG